jgi:O-antigen ligase
MWFFAVTLIVCILIYAPQYSYAYRAPKAYLFALAIFGGFLLFPPASAAGVLPGLIAADAGVSLLLCFLLRRPYADREALFQHILLIGWAFLIAGRQGRPNMLLYALLIAAAVVTLLALAEFAGYGLGKRYWHDFGTLRWGKIEGRRPAACLGNPDVLGSFSAAALPLAFALLYPFNAVLAVIGLILSQARAAWIAAGLPGLPLIASYLWLSRNDILKDYSVQQRLKYYRLAWSLIQERFWFGHGPGSFKILSQRDWQETPRISHVHCEWLELWHDTGLIGVLLRLAILITAISRLAQAGRVEMAFAACLLVLAVDGCFSLSLRTIALKIVWWTGVGIAMQAPAAAVCHWHKPLLLAIPNAAILLFMADRHYKLGLSYLMGFQLESAMRHLLRVVQMCPWHRDARYALATACSMAGQKDLAHRQLEKLSRYDPYYVEMAEFDTRPRPPAAQPTRRAAKPGPAATRG